ncbi:hypothetical protein IP88_00960 [alpha proteobacterium AAP81b]|nr:hypothetical protein IP88_00960 [alpha proteobacterium AAP81b]
MKLLATALAAVVLAMPAAAQDFQGPWVEARLGWDQVEGSSGLVYGGGAGYDFKLGKSLVLGVQGGIAGSTIRECALGVCANAGRDFEVLARFGGKVTDTSLLYALAGYANGRVAANDGFTAIAFNLDGYRLGAGYELAFNRHLFAKAEYRYTGYDFDVDRHQVTASIGYRF